MSAIAPMLPMFDSGRTLVTERRAQRRKGNVLPSSADSPGKTVYSSALLLHGLWAALELTVLKGHGRHLCEWLLALCRTTKDEDNEE